MSKVIKESKKRKNAMSHMAKKRAMTGRLFILPWFIGLVYFFIIPFIQSIVYTFNKVKFSREGATLNFIGFKNYVYAFTEDGTFVKKLTESLQNMIPNVLVIVFFSLFVAIILKNNFKGRTLARSIFFLPVIISSGVVIKILKDNVMRGDNALGNQTTFLFKIPSFTKTLTDIGLPVSVLDQLTKMVDQLFDLTWKSGVQIILLLAAVNNIPKSSYEVADMEGATEWEKFWKITFPLVSPTMLVAVVYSVIDSFTDYGNPVMQMVTEYMRKGNGDYSSTIALIYFVAVLIITGLITLIISRRVFYVTD